MKTLTMRYPGDLPCKVEVVSREEFFTLFPPESRQFAIGPLGSPPEVVIPIGEQIMCDFCNEDPGDTLYLVSRSRAYCGECFKRNLERYCS